jgi:hypothetical protein
MLTQHPTPAPPMPACRLKQAVEDSLRDETSKYHCHFENIGKTMVNFINLVRDEFVEREC